METLFLNLFSLSCLLLLKFKMSIWALVDLWQLDHINYMITLSVIPLKGLPLYYTIRKRPFSIFLSHVFIFYFSVSSFLIKYYHFLSFSSLKLFFSFISFLFSSFILFFSFYLSSLPPPVLLLFQAFSFFMSILFLFDCFFKRFQYTFIFYLYLLSVLYFFETFSIFLS